MTPEQIESAEKHIADLEAKYNTKHPGFSGRPETHQVIRMKESLSEAVRLSQRTPAEKLIDDLEAQKAALFVLAREPHGPHPDEFNRRLAVIQAELDAAKASRKAELVQ